MYLVKVFGPFWVQVTIRFLWLWFKNTNDFLQREKSTLTKHYAQLDHVWRICYLLLNNKRKWQFLPQNLPCCVVFCWKVIKLRVKGQLSKFKLLKNLKINVFSLVTFTTKLFVIQRIVWSKCPCVFAVLRKEIATLPLLGLWQNSSRWILGKSFLEKRQPQWRVLPLRWNLQTLDRLGNGWSPHCLYLVTE